MVTKRKISPAARERAAEKNREHLAALQAEITEAVESMRTPEGWSQWLKVAAALPNYSFLNTVGLWAQANRRGVTPSGFASFRMWKKLGYPVNKGEKSYRVFAPVVRKLPFDREGNLLDVDEAKNMPTGEVQWIKRVVGYKAVPVFETGQTSAPSEYQAELPEELQARPLSGVAPAGLIDRLIRFAESKGTTVHFPKGDDYNGGEANGYFAPGTNTITVRGDMENAMIAKTLAHEIAHMHLEHSPCNRDERRYCEIEAESVAYLVTNATGLNSAQYTFAYVGGWAHYDAEAVQATGQKVIEAAHEIIEAIKD